jgi:DNA-3-methyladenine glycosylase II
MSRSASLTVPLVAPLDVPRSLAGLGHWGDDLIDRWDGNRWLRAWPVDGRWVAVRATAIGDIDTPALDVTAAVPDIDAARAAVAHAFAASEASNAALAALIEADPAVAAADARFHGVRPLLQAAPFTALIRAISAQQVNLRWAAEIRKRLALGYGKALPIEGEEVRMLDPERLAGATVDELRDLQLTRTKSASVIEVAQAAVAGRLDAEELATLEDEALIERLVQLRGIGRWSAEWFLARTLGRPRVVAGDLGVRKAVGRAYFSGRLPSEAEVRVATAHWGAAAGIVQQVLLHTLVDDEARERAR